MIHIAICDDDRETVQSIETLLQENAAELHVEISCESFYDGAALTETITEQNAYFDIVYLDIEMGGMDGIRAAELLRALDLPMLIVYVSGHEEYLKELFSTEPFRFLSKPIESAAFRDVFLSACRRLQNRAGYFSFTYKKAVHKIPYDRIAYFESRGRQIHIHMAEAGSKSGNTDMFYGKMNDLEKRFPSPQSSRFLRIHQSFLVNFDHIKSIGFTEVVMMDGTVLPISADRQKTAKTRFCLLLNKKETPDD